SAVISAAKRWRRATRLQLPSERYRPRPPPGSQFFPDVHRHARIDLSRIGDLAHVGADSCSAGGRVDGDDERKEQGKGESQAQAAGEPPPPCAEPASRSPVVVRAARE